MVRSSSISKEAHLKILIVEDNRSFQQFFKENLQSRFPSLEIFEAADGEKALETVEVESPNLIFMDIQLSGENGLSLTQKIISDISESLPSPLGEREACRSG